eukprot:scaffold326077_cov61-Tisochrysis_lutea.AAC.1
MAHLRGYPPPIRAICSSRCGALALLGECRRSVRLILVVSFCTSLLASPRRVSTQFALSRYHAGCRSVFFRVCTVLVAPFLGETVAGLKCLSCTCAHARDARRTLERSSTSSRQPPPFLSPSLPSIMRAYTT